VHKELQDQPVLLELRVHKVPSVLLEQQAQLPDQRVLQVDLVHEVYKVKLAQLVHKEFKEQQDQQVLKEY
jgi:hypothetical protein